MNYDAEIIREHAEQLYSQAKSITVASTILYTIIVAGIGTSVAATDPLDEGYAFTLFGCAAIAGGMGYDSGMSESFRLRLEAQSALA